MSCALPLVHVEKNSPAVAGFVPVQEEHHITQDCRGAQALPKHPDSLSSVKPLRVCPISVRIHIFQVQELQ